MESATARTPEPVSTPATFADGLGERYYTVVRDTPLEVLTLRDDLAAVSSFEFALRERVSRLAGFQHEAFGRVLGVERLDDRTSTLGIVSEHVTGSRLSRVLAVADEQLLALEIDAALCLLRQLVAAIASLHEKVSDVCHGAIGPERLIITTDGRLMVVEHVLGAALEQLRYSHQQYWADLRIPLPRSASVPRFDRRVDVTQIGTVALALILGRPLGGDEYPGRVSEVAGGAMAISTTGSVEPLPSALRSWLFRALQLDPRASFSSAVEAREELEKVLAGSDPAIERNALQSFLTRYHGLIEPDEWSPPQKAVVPPLRATQRPAAPSPVRATADPVRPATPEPLRAVSFAPEPVPSPAPATLKPAAPVPVTSREAVRVVERDWADPEPAADIPHAAADDERPAGDRPQHPTQPRQAAAAAEIDRTNRPFASVPMAPTPSPTPDTSSDIAAAPASSAPVKPEDFFLPREEDAPEARPSRASRPRPARRAARHLIAAGVALAVLAGGAMAVRRALPAPPVIVPLGTLSVNTNPVGARVLIDGEMRGTTPIELSLPPGQHTLEIVHNEERRTIPVTIAAGAQVSQFIEMPDAPVSVGRLLVRTEPPGARVSVGGTVVGTAPVTVERLTPGTHTVVLETGLGSLTHQVTIEAGATASLVVPITVPQGAPVSGWISVNAPADVQVYEGGRLLGSSRSERIMVAAGRHQLEIVNDAIGYRSTHVVQVAPGRVSPITLDWPKGTVAINAVPWAEVWIGNQRIGETPIGSVSVPIGSQEIVFRHPDLGERRVNVLVRPGAPARVSVDMRN